jgi:AcrR family transcriptional regulator
LRERKRQRAREAIVEAAFELFAERGFAEVTVADIAERAEVGRTTFFRYFGDKQEVVFAHEQDMLDELADTFRVVKPPSPPDLAGALRQLQAAATMLCERLTSDARRYAAHERLIFENPELHDREERKLRRFTELGSEILRGQGASEWVAALAPQLALACFRAAREIAGPDRRALGPALTKAFDHLPFP